MTDTRSFELSIAGMTCGHCVAAVQRALTGIPGITDTHVTVGGATVVVAPNIDVARVRTAAENAIEQAGYAIETNAHAVSSRAGGSCCCSTPRS